MARLPRPIDGIVGVDPIKRTMKSREAPLRNRCGWAVPWALWQLACVDSFPYFQPMDRNIGIGLEAKAHAAAPDLEHGDLENALKAVGASDYHGFLAFP
jgi:hypothetical protein